MNISIFWWYTSLVLIVVSIHLFMFILNRKNIRTNKIQVSSFKLMLTIFLNIIETYKTYIYEPTLEKNSKQFNLDPTEKTNSILAYNKMQNELLIKSANEILTKYVLPECLDMLKNYYNMDYIMLLIITNLKKGLN